MCRKYGPIYEQLAQEQFKLFDFYRVNNDKNKFS